MGSNALYGVAAEAIQVPDTCTAIESGAFSSCGNLVYVFLPAALENSVDLDTIGIPSTVEVIYY